MCLDLYNQDLFLFQLQTANLTLFSTGKRDVNLDTMITSFNGRDPNSKNTLIQYVKSTLIKLQSVVLENLYRNNTETKDSVPNMLFSKE